MRDELCGLTKKKLATVIVGLFFLKENAPTKKLATVIVRQFSLKQRRLKTRILKTRSSKNVPLGSSNIHSVAKYQKMKGVPFGDNFKNSECLIPEKI